MDSDRETSTGRKTPLVMHVVGARPQFIKLAPVAQAFREGGVPFKVIHTGQHYDYTMSDLHFETLKIDNPDFHLDIGSSSHARQTGAMLMAIEEVLMAERPDLVLVYGDTNSTLAGALAAAKLRIKVGHVEAGVRSFDRNMPEEINRVVTDHLSDCHFCPTMNAVRLLAKEGIGGIFTGDVMYDALLKFTEEHIPSPYAPPFVLATIHRAENTDDPVKFPAIWQGLERVSEKTPVIFPAHPRTLNLYPDLIRPMGDRLRVIEPVSYLAMLAMVREASCVITDSGGVQKEAFLLKTPCVTVRDTTEWTETIEAGANRMVEADPETILMAAREMEAGVSFGTDNPFGDGFASRHIVDFIKINCL